MTILHVVILAIVQGLAELLPVSSSAHVVVAEKLMGLDPTSPEMTLLLVMLHTGTMLAVIVYFWKQWMRTYFQSMDAFKNFAAILIVATALTGIIGEGLIKAIEKFGFHGAPNAEVEQLFGRLDLIAPALAAGGLFILFAGIYERRHAPGADRQRDAGTGGLGMSQGALIGIVQAFCLPFRGFSQVGRNHLHRLAGRTCKTPRRSLQFRAGGGSDAGRRRPRVAAPDEGGASHRRLGSRLRIGARPDGHGLRLPGRPPGAEMAK